MAKNNIGNLSAILTADTADFTNKIKAASGTLSSFAGNLKTVSRLIPGLIPTLSLASVGAFTKSVLDAADRTADLADATGLTITQYQEWEGIARKVGVSNETLSSGIEQLSKRIGDAAAGEERANIAFAKMGITVKDTAGNIKDTDDILREVIANSKGLDASSLRDTMSDLVGDATEWKQILNLSGYEIDQIKQGLHDSGQIQDEEVVKAAAELQTRYEELTRTVGTGLYNAWMNVAVAPATAV
jgi:hypothetical protein